MNEILDRIAALEQRIDHIDRIEPHVIACRVYNNANISHSSSGNWQAVTFNSERWDATDMHSTSSNTSRITVSVAGWYLINGCIRFAADTTGQRGIAFRIGGSTYIADQFINATSAQVIIMNIASLYYLAATNYVELMGYQNSGGALNMDYVANYSPEFAAIRLP